MSKFNEMGLSADKVVMNLEVVLRLSKLYGRLIYTDTYLDMIKNVSSDIYDMIKFLREINKSKSTQIKTLISYTKKYGKGYHKQFVVKADKDSHYEEIKKFLDKKFDGSKIEKHTTLGNSIRVSGEGWYYKRGLEQDVKKLLKL